MIKTRHHEPTSGDEPVSVLLIEDNESQMKVVRHYLESCANGRFIFEWSENLTLGIEQATRYAPDVILLDLGLPECTGVSCLLEMRRSAPHVPIVVLTADDSCETEAAVMTAGADDYLIKQEMTSGRQLSRTLRAAVVRQKSATSSFSEGQLTNVDGSVRRMIKWALRKIFR